MDKKFKILKEILGEYRQSGAEHIFYCPYCKHHKPKFSINMDKGAKCWVCGWATPNLFRIVRRFGDRRQKDEWRDLDESVNIGDFSAELFEENVPTRLEEVVGLPEGFVTLTGASHRRSARYPLKYLSTRGISSEDILFWKMGYCTHGPYANRIIVPSFNLDGDLNYFVARTYADDWPKYKNPAAQRDIVFNELWVDWDQPIVLVEGVFDAVKAGPNAIPLLGSTLRDSSHLLQKIVAHNPPVFLALDKDAQVKSWRMARHLLEYGVRLYKIDLAGYNDVGEMSKDDFLELKHNAELLQSDCQLLVHALQE